MTHLAKVLIVSNDRQFADGLAERLARNGYHCGVVTSADAALRVAREDTADVVLIGPVIEDMDGVDLVSRFKADPELARIAAFLISDRPLASVCQSALDAGADDVILAPFEEPQLLARLRPLARLATMRDELHRRAATASRFGVTVDDKPVFGKKESGYQVLVVAGAGSEVLPVLVADAELTVSGDLYEAEDLLTRRNFDAAVVVVEGDHEAYYGLCGQVRNNPRLFNLPVLLVTDHPDGTDDGYRYGASRVLSLPIDPPVLRAAVLTLVRRQRLRWEVRDRLLQTLQSDTRDAATGLYRRDYLMSYLDGRFREAQRRRRHLSVIFFRAPSIEGVRQTFGDEAAAHLRLQLGQWITSLLRAEDLVALFGDNEFCVVLPDTPIEEAEVVMHRIAGVLAYTDFAVKDVYQPIKAWVQVGSADLQPDDTVASMLARARHNLD